LAAKLALGIGGALIVLLLAAIVLGGRSKVEIISEPSGASVLVDDELVGRTPLKRVRLRSGSELTVRKAGYIEQSLVREKGDKNRSLTIELVPRVVELTSDPAGATVKVDGREVGTTPHLLEALADGTKVVVSLEGYVGQTVTIGPGDETLSVELERAAGTEPTDPASLIAALWSRVQNTSGFSIELRASEMSGNRLPVGVPISFEIYSEAAAHLSIFTLGEDGTIVCMYPNQAHSELAVGAGEIITLPSSNDRVAGFSLETDVPYGTDRVFALASQSPFSSLPLTASSTRWLSAYPFTEAPGGVPALAFYRWIVDRLDTEPETSSLSAFEMEIVP